MTAVVELLCNKKPWPVLMNQGNIFSPDILSDDLHLYPISSGTSKITKSSK